MTTSPNTDQVLTSRWTQLQQRLVNSGVDGLVITGGADMEYLTGYKAMPLERITALVVGAESLAQPVDPDKRPSLLVPELELPRVVDRPSVFRLAGWNDKQDPIKKIVAGLGESQHIAISDTMRADHTLRLQDQLASATRARSVTLRSIAEKLGGLRSIKSPLERKAMQTVGAMADRVASQIQGGEVPLVGRKESEVAADIAARLLDVGHETVEFVIVASGPNSASPHHHPEGRIIEAGEMVLCDFGGKYQGYCSDTTRCVFTGRIPEEVAEAYAVLYEAQAAGVEAAQPGWSLAGVDRSARGVIAAAGYGDYFVHRTGHGIGFQVHEEPYVTDQAEIEIKPGHVFSVEPGIYLNQKWGMRLEDIVVVNDDGPLRCNNSDHHLISVGS